MDQAVGHHRCPGDRAVAAVLVQEAVVDAWERDTFGEQSGVLRAHIAVIGVDEVGDVASHQFLFRPAKHAGPRRIDPLYNSVEPEHEREIGRDLP